MHVNARKKTVSVKLKENLKSHKQGGIYTDPLYDTYSSHTVGHTYSECDILLSCDFLCRQRTKKEKVNLRVLALTENVITNLSIIFSWKVLKIWQAQLHFKCLKDIKVLGEQTYRDKAL